MSLPHKRRARAKLASKVAQIHAALIAAGCDTIAKQATAFGLPRSTTWAVLNQDMRSGPSAKVVKRILSSQKLPPEVRRKIEEHVLDKTAGLYGHSKQRIGAFRAEFAKANYELTAERSSPV